MKKTQAIGKLKRRMQAPMRRVKEMLAGIISATKQYGGTREEAIEGMKRRPLDRDQWRRWYKANKKYQRQLRATKQALGWKIPPHLTGLPRWIVP